MVRISEFQTKDVVNISDGRKLGNIGDIEINLETGKIETIIIGYSGKLLGFFGKDEEIIIPWNHIVKVGEDVILVRHQNQQYVQQQLEVPKN
ncbi:MULTISPECIES: YlmC/YmxH family sporulation protein [Bacillaceae]|uniref:YlmC/YmxH family sporulation protein n=1 Tax=Lederbergia citri TaxID=2833580 RepID=A0A942YEH4_9BACI|nr:MULTISPECIES: YlmC/YmxH family sporulation protein [Bacillaceae]MBS4193908.1 YlmC/YmxH family sporulation protein [Lederbergia citri]MBS4217826.1 YlmC/YmxH family sporulation protein [Bacillus sp. FJAT-49711]MCR2820799.1 YlmC/YmxH family sporulation protein [Lederbergia panacisoli]